MEEATPRVFGDPNGAVCEYCQAHIPAKAETYSTGTFYSLVEHQCEAKLAARQERVDGAAKAYWESLRYPTDEQAQRVRSEAHLPRRSFPGLHRLERTRQNEAALMAAEALLRDFQAGQRDRGLYLHGPMGAGKTAILTALGYSLRQFTGEHRFEVEKPGDYVRLARWGSQYPASVQFWPVPDWFVAVNREWVDRNEDIDPAGAETCEALLWDDIGKQHDTGWKASELFRVVNLRYNAMLSTSFTSNYSPSELCVRMVEVLGAEHSSEILAMVDRIKETCMVIELKGRSWRQR